MNQRPNLTERPTSQRDSKYNKKKRRKKKKKDYSPKCLHAAIICRLSLTLVYYSQK